MSYEIKAGSGSMFKNEKKETEKHPDYNGTVVLPDGTECWINAWVKRPDGKKPYMSISIQPKQVKAADSLPASPKSHPQLPEDDSMPF